MTAPDRHGLSLIEVTKHFGAELVVDRVTLHVAMGQVLALVGPSGAGKSTLLRCINHLVIPDSGLVSIDGEVVGYAERSGKLHKKSHRELARQRAEIGMVFQHFNLFPHLTAVQNVALALRVTRKLEGKAATDRARELLVSVGLASKLLSYPQGLSGGQQQRVAIARALALRPKLMLFDEPTSALDPEFVGEVREVILKVAATGMTMVIVTHDIAFARQVSSVAAFIDCGRLVEFGPTQTVLSSPASARARSFLASV